jgi:hypothetical protein
MSTTTTSETCPQAYLLTTTALSAAQRRTLKESREEYCDQVVGIAHVRFGSFRKSAVVSARSVPPSILLQKSFWGGARRFLEALMHFLGAGVRDHIVSSKIDHGPP